MCEGFQSKGYGVYQLRQLASIVSTTWQFYAVRAVRGPAARVASGDKGHSNAHTWLQRAAADVCLVTTLAVGTCTMAKFREWQAQKKFVKACNYPWLQAVGVLFAAIF